jgi:hypothetical protein
MSKLEERVSKIEKRNKKVERDKKWETSTFRKIIIAILTYGVIVIFFYAAKLSKPLINSIVPTVGFILSTLSLNIFKKIWEKRNE